MEEVVVLGERNTPAFGEEDVVGGRCLDDVEAPFGGPRVGGEGVSRGLVRDLDGRKPPHRDKRYDKTYVGAPPRPRWVLRPRPGSSACGIGPPRRRGGVPLSWRRIADAVLSSADVGVFRS